MNRVLNVLIALLLGSIRLAAFPLVSKGVRVPFFQETPDPTSIPEPDPDPTSVPERNPDPSTYPPHPPKPREDPDSTPPPSPGRPDRWPEAPKKGLVM